MTLNILYGGDDYDLSTGDFCAEPDGCPQTLRELERLIRDARADVVGVQEPERNAERIAADLGWYGSNRAHVISRYPLIDPPGSGGLYVFVQVAPGRVIAVANTHLPSDPYGPYLVRDGGTRDEVLALERSVRLPAVQPLVRVLPTLARQGIPVLLTGDFNSPSHLDWTPPVAAVRPEVRYPVRWPASAALADAGLVDTFREAHPDPVRTPGFTWTPGGPETDPHEVYDRIDWVLRAGPTRTIASEVVPWSRAPHPSATTDATLATTTSSPAADHLSGTSVAGPSSSATDRSATTAGRAPHAAGSTAAATGAATADAGRAPYPTDHRGVVSTVDVQAAVPPALVAPATRRVTVGQPLAVAFHQPASRGGAVALVDDRGRTVAAQPTGRTDGTVTFRTKGLARGHYRLVLLAAGGRQLSGTDAWFYAPEEGTSLTVDRPVFKAGQPIGLHFTGAPGMGLDWVSIFRCTSDGCAGNDEYLVYAYTGSAIEGAVSIGPGSTAGYESWPLPPGRYVARLLPDDGLRSVASSSEFRIAA
ncbi:endonuclease/exonuclease/phosphatase family protein [Dactylosporangium sp. CS-033363]|uniref:endonuclease/exonuclease/phosphatase family protein n=1 Tax=Dactylosporangium sp. CS-033363 TaxID=3239935 RepID=UPI003D92F34B